MKALHIAPLRLDGADDASKRDEIRQVFHATFTLDEHLYDHLASDRAWYGKAIALRHPLIFYFGHTATFYVNKFLVAGILTEHVDARLESMFAVGVDEMSWDDLDDSHYDWPAVEEVRAYRAKVRAVVDHAIRTMPLTLPIAWDSPWWAVMMGIEHENIHMETSSVLIRQLPLEVVRPVPDLPPEPADERPAPENTLVPVPGGTVRLGKERDNPRYGWDNEYGAHVETLAEFAASRYLVSNGEFLPFVQSGGYSHRQWWSEEGWAWRQYADVGAPTFWVRRSGQWLLRLLAEERAMPWDWPVEVNYHEAEAFCAWKSHETGQPLRLPTEAEWRRLLDLADMRESDEWPEAPAQIGLAYGCSPCPVDRFRHGDVYDVVGNVWQWSVTPMYPFDGFEVHPYYDDFTVPTFDQQHNLIKGGSFISLGNETQRESRYAFRRHFFQHAGFRYVRSDNPVLDVPVYESDPAVAQSCDAHYGEEHFGVPNYPRAMAQLAVRAMGDRPLNRALDIGCSVGRSSFELARHFAEVTAVDVTARIIQVGVQLKERGRFPYAVIDEGELESYRWADLTALQLTDAASRVQFFQADPGNLKPLFRDYDLVLAANLLDHLREPEAFLTEIGRRMRPGGRLVISSPYAWTDAVTPRAQWLGGFKRDGETYTSLDGLKDVLAGRFRLLPGFPRDVPFVIRETARQYRYGIAQATAWERLV
jgi:5-histidylcysteine sulfoxide synthase/putative 4-mercaptohistidine N1-methyltranferase